MISISFSSSMRADTAVAMKNAISPIMIAIVLSMHAARNRSIVVTDPVR